jgi:hypothetical protein
MSDQMRGIRYTRNITFLLVQSSKPNVKIVVGHGAPKVGDEGYE